MSDDAIRDRLFAHFHNGMAELYMEGIHMGAPVQMVNKAALMALTTHWLFTMVTEGEDPHIAREEVMAMLDSMINAVDVTYAHLLDTEQAIEDMEASDIDSMLQVSRDVANSIRPGPKPVRETDD